MEGLPVRHLAHNHERDPRREEKPKPGRQGREQRGRQTLDARPPSQQADEDPGAGPDADEEDQGDRVVARELVERQGIVHPGADQRRAAELVQPALRGDDDDQPEQAARSETRETKGSSHRSIHSRRRGSPAGSSHARRARCAHQ